MANVENLGTLERRVSVSVPVADIEKQVSERLKKLARDVRMPGFRPGKVPMKILAQTYGPQVHNEVLGDASLGRGEAGRRAAQPLGDRRVRGQYTHR